MADFQAVKTDKGWRVFCGERNMCGALDEQVARETAKDMNAYRMVHR